MAQKGEEANVTTNKSDSRNDALPLSAELCLALNGADKNMCEKSLECPVCLQTCIHPVKLPCNHIFCFLCIKGVANQSKRCALCRREIPLDFLNNPLLIKKEQLEEVHILEDGKQWFYEGHQGWWQYDERTTSEMEERFKAGDKHCEILIAGFLYVIDFEQMLQYRRSDHTRRRRIKRDLANAPKKGVAGLKFDGEGNTGSGSTTNDNGEAADTTTAVVPPSDCPAGQDGVDSNQADGVSPSDEDLSATMASLTLGGARLDHRHYFDIMDPGQPQQRSAYPTRSSRLVLETPSSSSDSDWD